LRGKEPADHLEAEEPALSALGFVRVENARIAERRELGELGDRLSLAGGGAY
jgi:hypothetical protein